MNLPKLYNKSSCSFLVIAHRGASHYSPENTIAAFRLAHEMGADMIELDVQLSKDGIPVVIHDANLSKTTNGRGNVSQFMLKELQELDAGSWFSVRFQQEKIPSLEEVLEWAAGKISLNIEIKPEASARQEKVEEKVLELVRSYRMEEYVLISSFDPKSVLKFRQLAPELVTGLLFDRSSASPAAMMEKYEADLFHVNRRWLNTRRMNHLREKNIPVLTYTVNQPRQMRQLIRSGVTGIFSDRPDLLKETADMELTNRCG